MEAEKPKKQYLRAVCPCTPEIITKVETLVMLGCFPEVAAAEAGISIGQYTAWLKKGAAGDPAYREFYERVSTARARAENLLITQLRDKGKDDPRTLQWMLERMAPKRWGTRLRVELDKEMSAVLGVLEKTLPEEHLNRVLAALASLDGRDEDAILAEAVESNVVAGNGNGEEDGEAARLSPALPPPET